MQGREDGARRNQSSFFWPAFMAIMGTILTSLSIAVSPFAFNNPLFGLPSNILGLSSETIALAGAAAGTMIMVVSMLFVLKQPNITKGKLSYSMSLLAIGAEVALGKYLMGSLGLLSLPILAALTAVAIAGLIYAHRETKRIPQLFERVDRPNVVISNNQDGFVERNDHPAPENSSNGPRVDSAELVSSPISTPSNVQKNKKPSSHQITPIVTSSIWSTPNLTPHKIQNPVETRIRPRNGRREKVPKEKEHEYTPQIDLKEISNQRIISETITDPNSPFQYVVTTYPGSSQIKVEKLKPKISPMNSRPTSPTPVSTPSNMEQKFSSTPPLIISSRPTSPTQITETDAYDMTTEHTVILDSDSKDTPEKQASNWERLKTATIEVKHKVTEATKNNIAKLFPPSSALPLNATVSPPSSPSSGNDSHGDPDFKASQMQLSAQKAMGEIVDGEDREESDYEDENEEENPFAINAQETEKEKKRDEEILGQVISDTRTSRTPSITPLELPLDTVGLNNYLGNLRNSTSPTPSRSPSPTSMSIAMPAPQPKAKKVESIEETKARIQRKLLEPIIPPKGGNFVASLATREKDKTGEGTGTSLTDFKASLDTQISTLKKSIIKDEKERASFLLHFANIPPALDNCFTLRVSDQELQKIFNAPSILAIFSNKADVDNLIPEALKILQDHTVSGDEHPLIHKEIENIKTALTQIESVKKSVPDLWEKYLKASMHLDHKNKTSEKTAEAIVMQVIDILKLGATHELILPAFKNAAYSSRFIQQFIPIVIEKAKSVLELTNQLEFIRVALAKEFDARALRERIIKEEAIALIKDSIQALRVPSTRSTVMGSVTAAFKSEPLGTAQKIADKIINTLMSGAKADEILPTFKVDDLEATDDVTLNISKCLATAQKNNLPSQVQTEIRIILQALDNIATIQQSVHNLFLATQDPKELKILDSKIKAPENRAAIVKKIIETLELGVTHELIQQIFKNEAYSSRFIQQFISPLEAAKSKHTALTKEIEKLISALQKKVSDKHEFEDTTKKANLILIGDSIEGRLKPSSSSTRSIFNVSLTKFRSGSAPLTSEREIVDKIIETLKLDANTQEICTAFKADRCPSDFIQSFILILNSKKTEQNETVQKKINDITSSLHQSLIQKKASENFEKRLVDIAFIRDSIDTIGTSLRKQSDDNKRLTTYPAIVKKIIETLESGAGADEIQAVFQAKLQDATSKNLNFLKATLEAFEKNSSTLDSVNPLKEYLKQRCDEIERQLQNRKEPQKENKHITSKPAELVQQDLRAFSQQKLTAGLEEAKASRVAQTLVKEFIIRNLTADEIWTNIIGAELNKEHINFLLQEKFWKDNTKLRTEVTKKMRRFTTQPKENKNAPPTTSSSQSSILQSFGRLGKTLSTTMDESAKKISEFKFRSAPLDAKQTAEKVKRINDLLDKFKEYETTVFALIPQDVVDPLLTEIDDDAELAIDVLVNGVWNNKLTLVQAQCISYKLPADSFLVEDEADETNYKYIDIEIKRRINNMQQIKLSLTNVNGLISKPTDPTLEANIISTLVNQIKTLKLPREDIANVLIKAHKENVITYTQLERILLKYCGIPITDQHKECESARTPQQREYASLIQLINKLGGGVKHEEQESLIPSSHNSSSSTSSSSMAERNFESWTGLH